MEDAKTKSDDSYGTKGIVCARCGCKKFRTTKTERMPGKRVRRYKKCAKCGGGMSTMEVTMGRYMSMR